MKHVRLLFALAMAVFISSCSQPKELEYRDVHNFSLRSLGVRATTIGMDMEYYNPNDFSLQMKGGDIDVFMNDKYLGKAALDNRITIPKMNTFLIPVSLTVDLKSMLMNSWQLLTNKDVTIKMKGYVKVGKGSVFIRVPVDFVTQQRVEIR